MAIINFEPTWISVNRQVQGLEYDQVRSSEPIEIANPIEDGDLINSLLGFEMQEILKVLERSQTPGKSDLKMDVLQTTQNFVVALHREKEPFIGHPNYRTLDVIDAPQEIAGYLISLNDLYFNNRNHTLAEAIQLGWNGGLYIYKAGHPSSAGHGLAENVSIQIEGEWDNQTPTVQGPVGGAAQNVAEPIEFNWTHNGVLDQANYEVRYRLRGASNWITRSSNTSRSSHTVPANSLSLGDYEWQVRTTSEYGFISPWSSLNTFTVAELPPTPTILRPSENETIEISDLKIAWESDAQYSFELELLSEDGSLLERRTGMSAKEINIPGALDNHTDYRVRLRISNQSGLLSAWTEVNFNVDYTGPAEPIIEITPNKETSSLKIKIINPVPTGTYPTPVRQDLFKRELGGSWIKLANLLPNSDFVDYAVASGQQYEYRVTVYADNDTSITSSVFRNSVEIDQTVINVANEPNIFVKFDHVRERSALSELSAIRKQFAGRKYPVTEFGETVENNIEIESLIESRADYDYLVNMINRQETLIYRDGRGRKMYATVSGLTVVDESLGRYSVSMAFSQVDYKEGID